MTPIALRWDVLGVSLAALVLVAQACGGDDGSDTNTFTWEDLSFEYPSDFEEGALELKGRAAGTVLARTFAFRGDDDSLIAFFVDASIGYPTSNAEEDIGEWLEDQIDELVESEVWREGTARPAVVEVGGLPAIYREWGEDEARSYNDIPVTRLNWFVFDVEQQRMYQIVCQYKDEHSEDVSSACEQVTQTFSRR